MKRLLFVMIAILLLPQYLPAASVMTGAGSAIDDDYNKGKLEFCVFSQNKNYADPSWISEVMSPVSTLAKGGSELVMLPVYLLRSAERPLEQGISGKRQDASNCLRYDKRNGEELNATYTVNDLKAKSNSGDTLTADTVSLTVSITSDTE